MALQTVFSPAQIAAAATGTLETTSLPALGMLGYRLLNRSGLILYVTDDFDNLLDVVQPYVEKEGGFQIPSQKVTISTHSGDPVIQSASYQQSTWAVLIELSAQTLASKTTPVDLGQVGTWSINSLVLNGSIAVTQSGVWNLNATITNSTLAVTQSGVWNLNANITNANISVINSAGTSIVIKTVGVSTTTQADSLSSSLTASNAGGSGTAQGTSFTPPSRLVRVVLNSLYTVNTISASNLTVTCFVTVSLVPNSGTSRVIAEFLVGAVVGTASNAVIPGPTIVEELEMDMSTVFPSASSIKVQAAFRAVADVSGATAGVLAYLNSVVQLV